MTYHMRDSARDPHQSNPVRLAPCDRTDGALERYEVQGRQRTSAKGRGYRHTLSKLLLRMAISEVNSRMLVKTTKHSMS